MSKEEEENLVPLSPSHHLECMKNSEIKIVHKYTLGSVEPVTYSVQFDPNDKYIAAACGDGSIRIYNTLTGNQSYHISVDMDEIKPMTSVR